MMPLIDPVLTDSALAGDDSDVLIRVENVSKKFCRSLKRSLWYGVQDIAAEVIGKGSSDKLRVGEFWALKDISFELRRGEALGLVGANGAGKTTLLRIISGLIKPDAGIVKIRGRVAPLIALGAGFNPILTGRENIYVNMAILGLSKQEIDQRFEEVVEFAEIGDAIDAPVQSYSSGMAARLGFACAIHTEPDILLIDEVLSVGDIRFKEKCHTKLAELREKGTSFILVSHNPQIILGVCKFSIYLASGNLVGFGESMPVISIYERETLLFENKSDYTRAKLSDSIKKADKALEIISVSIKDSKYNCTQQVVCGEQIEIEILCRAYRKINHINLRMNFYDLKSNDQPIQFISNINDDQNISINNGLAKIVLKMPYLCFSPGQYAIKIVVREDSLRTLDYIESFKFSVISNSSMYTCSFFQPHSWNIIEVSN